MDEHIEAALMAASAKIESLQRDNAKMRADCRDAGNALASVEEENERLRAYANAAHWWAEAHDNELAEAGDTRFDVRSRMLDAEAALLAAGHVFERA